MAATILEESIDMSYEPDQEEILEYAEWLGMDVENNSDLLWIPKAGLKTPLPYPWKPCRSHDTNEIFYFNFSTGESAWDHPVDLMAQRQYHREIARKNKPCSIVSLRHTLDEETGKCMLSAITMGGNTLLEVQLERMDQTLLWLLKRVRNKLPKEPACRVKFLLADGRTLGKPEAKVPLLELLGLSAAVKQPPAQVTTKPFSLTHAQQVEQLLLLERSCIEHLDRGTKTTTSSFAAASSASVAEANGSSTTIPFQGAPPSPRSLPAPVFLNRAASPTLAAASTIGRSSVLLDAPDLYHKRSAPGCTVFGETAEPYLSSTGMPVFSF
jgi:centrosomal protein CEP164